MPDQETVTFSRLDSIRTRLTLAFILIVLLPMAVISAVLAISGSEGAQLQSAAQLDMAASFKENAITTWATTLKSELGDALIGEHTLPYVSAVVKQPRDSKEHQLARNALSGRFQQLMAETQRFEALFLMDRQGRVALSTEKGQEGRGYADKDFFQRGLKGPSVSLLSLNNTIAMIPARPILDESGKIVGVLAGRAGLGPLNEIMQNPTGLGRTGKTYLVSSGHTLLTALPATAPGIQVRSTGIQSVLEKRAKGSEAYKDFRGVLVRGVYLWLPEPGAALVAEQDKAESSQATTVVLAVNAGVALAAILLAAIASMAVTRSIAVPLSDLSETAARIAAGNLELIAEVQRKDEIGALAQTFNFMTGKLKQTMEGLRASEEKYRGIFENAVEGVFQSSLKGRFLSVNPAMARMLGYDSTDELLNNLTDFSTQLYVNPEDRAAFLRALYEQGKVTSWEVQFYRKDRQKIWVSISASLVRDNDGAPLYIEGLNTNITDRKNAEEALRESETRVRALLTTINVGVYRVTLDGRITQANPAMAKIFGYETPELLMETPISNLYQNPEDRKQFLRRLRGKKTITNAELAMKRRDGTPIWTSLSATAQYDTQGAIIEISGILEDITDRKLAEEALQKAHNELELRVLERTRELSEANSKLQELDRMKSMFLANMSHEIRTPMNGVIGMADLLRDTELDTEQQEYVTAIKLSADSLMTVINDILDFSKIEAKKLDFESIDFGLRDTLGETLHTLALRAAEKNIELVVDVRPDVPDSLIGDPSRIRQIILNLVGNAIKFTEQGEVVLSVAVEPQQGDGVFLHFAVADTGIGISPEKQARIFDAFSQADASTTRRYGGTGLGLTISSRLVEMMHGRIWVESAAEKGSTFHFTVRLGLQKGAVVRQVPAKLKNLEGLRVLVIDDNETNRRILEEILKSWRMKPSLVDSGRAALELMEKTKQHGEEFGLLLLDANMPVMDGFELAEKIKQHPKINGTTIMMLTSSGQRGDGARCRELGISGYLTKPIKQWALLDAITTVLGKTEPSVSKPPLVTSHLLREIRRPLKILLAEDDPINQKIATTMLTRRGHAVVVAKNGKAAIATLENSAEEPFNLVLMDVQMPEMDGLEATARIREKEKTTKTHVPIIALTAHAMKGAKEKCLKIGMDGYVSKPLRPDELFSAIEDLVPDQNSAEAAQETDLKQERKPRDVFNKEDAFSSVDGDMELFHEIVGMFVKECPTMVAQIGQALNEGNASAVDRASHKLKGVVGNFGGRNAYALALELEQLAKKNDLAGAKELFAALEKEMDHLKEALERFVKENSA